MSAYYILSTVPCAGNAAVNKVKTASLPASGRDK